MRTTLRVLVVPLAVAVSMLAGGSTRPAGPVARPLPSAVPLDGKPAPLDTMGRPDSSARDSSMRDTTWRDTMPDTLPKPKPKPRHPRPSRKPN